MRLTGAIPKIAARPGRPSDAKGPERAADLLRDAQHLIVEAAGLLGSGPEDGGLWDAVAILVEQREAVVRLPEALPPTAPSVVGRAT